jgi:hypothetical protein
MEKNSGYGTTVDIYKCIEPDVLNMFYWNPGQNCRSSNQGFDVVVVLVVDL